MSHISGSRISGSHTSRIAFLFAVLLFAVSSSNASQAVAADEGFLKKILAVPTGEERSSQPRFWLMEVEYKKMRLVWVPIKDAKSKTIKKQPVWYLCYRAVRRPIEQLGKTGYEPANLPNPEPGPTFFIPEFTLITREGKAPTAHTDVVIPEALKMIRKIEARAFKNSVQIVAPLTKATDKPIDQADETYWGVAMWRGVNPETDRFTVIMSGFSGGYQVGTAPGGKPLSSRKTIVQKFTRFGDPFDQDSQEFKFDGDPKWVYRPDTPVKSAKSLAPATPLIKEVKEAAADQ